MMSVIVMGMVVMRSVRTMAVMLTARRAVEGQVDQAPRVEAREHGRDHQGPEGDVAGRTTRRVSDFDDAVLREEPGKAERRARNADAGER
ncbi:hypothetical protein D3C72_2229450 [compost metagenome]